MSWGRRKREVEEAHRSEHARTSAELERHRRELQRIEQRIREASLQFDIDYEAAAGGRPLA